jgi:hypothetical protein
MPAGLRHVIGALAFLFIALGSPAAALAGGGGKCNASACKVYVEPNGPSAGKQQQPQTGGPTQPTGGPPSAGPKTHVPKNLTRALAQAGRDRDALRHLLAGSGVGDLSGNDSAGSPTVLGAAFDLGAGPLVLLFILLATALGLAARGSLRGRLRRRSTD